MIQCKGEKAISFKTAFTFHENHNEIAGLMAYASAKTYFALRATLVTEDAINSL